MLELLAVALKNWKLIAIGTLVAAVPASYTIGHWTGDTQGYNRRVAEVAAADLKAELERKGDNAKLAGMSDYDLCVSGLRGSGMPVDACDQLRGVPQSKP
ncbi:MULTISPECIES: hypothetical protein [unclassified Mesorhizobium]|uniref:hypothetical protein n=1 Tax=unclassified Mesorhizobium TaxID=325217 RepID=UPI0011286B3B|nr:MULTISPECIES: hypothetical protein [unclassified Mesorhizobium]TPK42326.1 hypothetical protein FJ550_30290 [Mesorhizobium sp. B2-5-2]TPL44479.1 hypothetical protein FJ961_03850 [Mesorhizobium sp. B2-4-5]TPM68666.1 hypothetical protein FJ968_29655 [Mesorhizobium sp. B2-1-6]TPN71774.1 hypothetical protein FJ985_30795 [Mesorhizobium sp. B1-1-2]